MTIIKKSTSSCLTQPNQPNQYPLAKHTPFIKDGSKNKLSILDWLWACVFTLAFTDVVISYFGQSINLPRPWILIIILFSIASFFSFKDFAKIKPWILIASLLLLLSLLIGTVTIDIPASIWLSNNEGLTKVKAADIVTMSAAFFIGLIWTLRQNNNAYIAADILLFVTAGHALISIIALLKLYPSIFPIIDMPYFKNGIMISRPEITTDQTRQSLYLFACLCVVFIRKSYIRLIISLAVSLMVIYIILKVQSRWSAILFAIYILLAYLLSLRYKTQTKSTIILLVLIGVILTVTNLNDIIALAQDIIWRFGEVDSGYGGRLISILYLFDKLADPSYWLPQGYANFYNKYKQAPHSFPTMIYLNAGLVGLICYFIVAVVPIIILFQKVLNNTATGIHKICFFMSSYAFLLLMTQPVITHEIFWLITGLAAGAVSRKEKESDQSRPKNRSQRVIEEVPS